MTAETAAEHHMCQMWKGLTMNTLSGLSRPSCCCSLRDQSKQVTVAWVGDEVEQVLYRSLPGDCCLLAYNCPCIGHTSTIVLVRSEVHAVQDPHKDARKNGRLLCKDNEQMDSVCRPFPNHCGSSSKLLAAALCSIQEALMLRTHLHKVAQHCHHRQPPVLDFLHALLCAGMIV